MAQITRGMDSMTFAGGFLGWLVQVICGGWWLWMTQVTHGMDRMTVAGGFLGWLVQVKCDGWWRSTMVWIV